MEINIPLLIDYLKKQGCPATINVYTLNDDAGLVVIQGDDPRGTRREHVEFSDIEDILILNGIIGRHMEDDSLVKHELALERTSSIDRDKRAGNIERLIYVTLAKYIAQLLLANLGKLYFPEIKPLSKHKGHFRQDN